jgi:Big-like domain-containing protein
MGKTQPIRLTACAAALFVTLGLGLLSTPPASAQVGGSLVVTITSPTSGSTVGGTIPMSADVTTIGGLTVQGVQFKVDGVDVGAEDTASPYSVQWDTRTVSNASHTLTAVARDALGVLWTSDPVTVTVFNDKTPPAVALTSPASGAVLAGTTTVTASASDNVGVAGVRFFVDGAPIGAEDTTAPYSIDWDTTTAASGSRTLTAVARDAAGNTMTSAPVVVIVSQTATRFENTSLAITYTNGTSAPGQPGQWWHGSRSRGWSGKIASFNRSAGAQARFQFTGTTVRWIGFRAPWAGIARVYVDDVFVTELDLYQTTEEPVTVVFSRTGLPYGPHSLTVESTGRKNPSSVDYAVVVDAFDVAPASPLPAEGTRTEESALNLTAGWSAAEATTRAWSGGTAVVSATAGAQATFSFLGTEVRWLGLRGPQTGIARVYLDGAFQAEVDLYWPTEYEAVVFEATTLAPAHHTLTIETTGRMNALATDKLVVVDAVDVRARLEEVDPSITYSAGWRNTGLDRNWSGSSGNTGAGTVLFSGTAGAQATITFTGSSVSWIGIRAPWSGIAHVSVDGTFVTDVDTYAPTEQVQAVLFTTSGLTDGPHTLTVEPTGTHNPASIDNWIMVDAFDLVLSPSAPTITRFQELDPSASYTDGWTQGTRFNFWSGETAGYSGVTGAGVTFTFNGTAVTWVGQHSFNGGIARVLLDGVEVAQVDTFAPVQEEFQAAMYAASGLAAGTHTLAIENTGQKNPAAQNTWVIVDAFDVH